jgi:hypothetical protein
MNKVVNEFPGLNTAHFISTESRWPIAVMLGLWVLCGCAFVYLASSASTLPSAAIVFLGIASALLLVALLSARGSIHYASDACGVYFPSRFFWIGGRAKVRTWLFVPWPNISRISVQPLGESGTKGVAFCLRASDEERRLYFARAATLDLGDVSGTDSSILVVYPSAFRSPYKIAAILGAFRQHSEQDYARSDLTPASDR